MVVELKVPAVGESITEVEIGDWVKKEGDFVNKDETVVEIETDKVTVELPSPVSGVITKILKSNDSAEVGEIIGQMEERAASESDSPTESDPSPESAASDDDPHVMPAAQRLIAENNLSANDIKGTGPGGRILKEDVRQHLDSASAKPTKAAPPVREEAVVTTQVEREEQTKRMTPMRRRIAERLVEAQSTAALLTTFNEVNMQSVMDLRKQYQDAFVKKYGIKLGFMSFFVKAAIEALKEIPAINAEIRGNDVVYRNYYDVGIAVSSEKGLVVPVLRNAERMSMAEVEQAIADFATRARSNRLELSDITGGTFSITNGGIFGSMLSTPIINPPQSGILGMHAIQQRPVAEDGQVVIRPMMYLALTYDHRIVDGREAVTFLVRIKEILENPVRILIEV